MVNIAMQNENHEQLADKPNPADDTGIVHVEGFLRILEIDTGQILLETRA
jgi:hypothetical protein